ncbi:unnamed protein product [Adineta steineri]|uniref:Uncharacterized protein n=1 Tax=Adineta steineri TaxID=433720 RepID=A0A814DT52_9BILA|nr:unnamed protein product [Adineta steineri]CAF0956944.1 unnamed protein product [Adineta steineri]CAF0961994.1 unnamed protein product [Adineta steineri]
MDTFKKYNICCTCFTTTSKYLLDCDHCQSSFCYECLLEHHHIDIYDRLLKQIQDINTIVARFIDHAHNQTEWVEHLTQDRLDLQIFVRDINQTPSNFKVIDLPTEFWLAHIDDLIKKDGFAIDYDCFWDLRQSKTQTSKPKRIQKYQWERCLSVDTTMP